MVDRIPENSSLLDNLKNNGLIKEVIGPFPNQPEVIIPTWAKYPAGEFFGSYIALGKKLSGKNPTAFVENTFPKVFFDRSDSEQQLIDQTYADFFQQRGCNVIFASNFLFEGTDGHLIENILRMHSRLNWKHFEKLLPEDKRQDLESINAAELLHASVHSLALDLLSQNYNLLLVGARSRAMTVEHRRVSKKPMSAILSPVFNSKEEIEEYANKLNGI